MKKKKVYAPGDTIDIENETHQELLQGLADDIQAASFSAQLAAKWNLTATKKLFSIATKLMPELKGYEYSINHDSNKITILGILGIKSELFDK